VWCWNLNTPGSRSEIGVYFWNVVLTKDGYHLDRPCEKWKYGREENSTRNKKKKN
jgi:hypothetical protein